MLGRVFWVSRCPPGTLGVTPSPLWGEGWGEGGRSRRKFERPHPTPLPRGERGPTEFSSPRIIAKLLAQQIEPFERIAIGHQEQRRLLGVGAMRRPVAMWQAEDVFGPPVDGLVADAACALALDHVTDRIAGRTERNGLCPVDLHQVAIHERHGRTAIGRVDVTYTPGAVTALGRGAHGGCGLRPGITEHRRIAEFGAPFRHDV